MFFKITFADSSIIPEKKKKQRQKDKTAGVFLNILIAAKTLSSCATAIAAWKPQLRRGTKSGRENLLSESVGEGKTTCLPALAPKKSKKKKVGAKIAMGGGDF